MSPEQIARLNAYVANTKAAPQPPDVKLAGRIDNPVGTLDDPILKMLGEQIAEAAKNPVQALAELDLHSTKKFTFRTRQNTVRQVRLRIPGLPESVRNRTDFGNSKNYGAEFERIYQKRYDKEKLAKFEALQDAVGGDLYIEFTPIPQRHECFYETDNDLIADFIRDYIVKNPGCHIYEDRGIQYIRSRWTDQLFPDTEVGRADLYAHDLAYERALRAEAEAEIIRLEQAVMQENAATEPDPVATEPIADAVTPVTETPARAKAK